MTEQYTETDLIRDLSAIRNDLDSCDADILTKAMIANTAANAAHDLGHVLNNLGAPSSELPPGVAPRPPVLASCDDGGYVPSDNNDPAKLAAFINTRLHNLRYYDGETALDGPYLMTAFRPWYGNVIYSPCGDEAQGAHVNALLQWNTQSGDVVSDLLPPYPGRNIGWRWGSIVLGSQWVVSAWLTNGAVAVQAQ